MQLVFEKKRETGTLSAMETPAKKPFIPNPNQLCHNPQRLAGGHRLCPGCGIGSILKQVLTVTDAPIVTANATGCSEICFSPYPYTSFKSPWIHSLFENAASVIGGVESTWKSLERRGQLTDKQKKIKFLAIGGDGATYDIGFQWLSGAIERGHNFTYLCFDNEGYMNTGYQRSSAVPEAYATNTTPVGSDVIGKSKKRKPFTRIIASHDLPYAAQINPAFAADAMKKAHRAFEVEGPAFLNAFSVCPTNWHHAAEDGLDVARLATESGMWPLYEFDNGGWRINCQPPKPEALDEFLGLQKRTRHLLKPENEKLLQSLRDQIDTEWNWIKKMAEAFPIT